MKYKKTVKAIFVERPNRFIAKVKIDGLIEIVHVKNTGRCKELLIPGVAVMLEDCEKPERKTRYDLICVFKQKVGWINMDSQAPNKVVGEWLASQPDCFSSITYVKPEYTYGQSRIDFYVEHNDKKTLIEVKGVTLERSGECFFPDAPTIRGVKHLHELTEAAKAGYECCIAFVIQIEGIHKVYPNIETHKEFGEALKTAFTSGVRILYLGCRVTENELYINSVNEEKNML